MKKRAKVGAARAKARRPKAAKVNRRGARKATTRFQSLPSGDETEVLSLLAK